jgi:hypothetical protein
MRQQEYKQNIKVNALQILCIELALGLINPSAEVGGVITELPTKSI